MDSTDSIDSPDGSSSDSSPDEPEGKPEKRKRGQQPGAKGHGRKRRDDLPTETTVHELPEDERCCPNCGKPFEDFEGTEDSDLIEWEVIIRRRVHKRKRYKPTCDCPSVPGIVTAPVPAKLILKGMFDISFWVRLLLDKFLFQRPLHRILKVLSLEGLNVSPGTVTGGLARIGPLLRPVYTGILERSRQANHWKMDETRWMVFEEVEGKTGYRWWLWVVITGDTVAYLLEPTRSASVIQNHLGEDPEGIINADRYAVYQSLGPSILVAFCWSHVRRDFERIEKSYPVLRDWAQGWVKAINEIFRLNDARLEVRGNAVAFEVADQTLREALNAMVEKRDRELADPHLHPAAGKALESLRRHWAGCILFVDHPDIPMDNNESERRLRDPVVGRKNYYGSGSVWSGVLAAMLFTILQTLIKNQIDPQKWLFAYLEACAQNGGRAPDSVDDFLPWNLPEDKKQAWSIQPRPP